MVEALLSSSGVAINIIGVIITLATAYYARMASQAFGDSTVGTASRDIMVGAVFWLGFMVLNSINNMDLIASAYAIYAPLVLDGLVVAGMFFFAIAFNRLSEVLN